MKKSPGLFFQIVTVVVGVCVFAFMLLEPHLEGRNVHATGYQIYFNDPFLAFAYAASVPFFTSLYHIFKVLEYLRHDKVDGPAVVKSLGTVKYCGMILIGFVVVGEVFIMMNDSDDRAGGVFMGLLVGLVSVVMAAVAAKFERRCSE